MSEIQTVAAGWYPQSDGRLRWWDGSQWTGHYNQPQHQTAMNFTAQAPVIMQQRKMYKTSHGFHLLMSICTFGLWLPVWLIVGVYNASKA